MRFTIIGAGNIGGAIARGFAACGAIESSAITVTARSVPDHFPGNSRL